MPLTTLPVYFALASDVGLLASMYTDGIQLKFLKKDPDINYGSIYENAVAHELKAHGFELYYFQSKKQGELDFLIEYKGSILPIEVHFEGNVWQCLVFPDLPNQIPKKGENLEGIIYSIDLSGLQ